MTTKVPNKELTSVKVGALNPNFFIPLTSLYCAGILITMNMSQLNMPNNANGNDKSIRFRPQFNVKAIKTSKSVGCSKQQFVEDGVQTQNYDKTKFLRQCSIGQHIW